MKYDILNRHTGQVQFTAEIKCSEGEPDSVKRGLAVKWAMHNGANLTGANLTGANLMCADLTGANLTGANLRCADLWNANLTGADLTYADLTYADLTRANLMGANLRCANLRHASLTDSAGISDRIIDGGLRSDGYRFLLTRTEPGDFRVKAWCRDFTVTEARKHWLKTRPFGEPLGDETRLIIKHMLAVAKLRGWKVWTEGEEQT